MITGIDSCSAGCCDDQTDMDLNGYSKELERVVASDKGVTNREVRKKPKNQRSRITE